jgi:septation ring formation regulator EzrA
MTDWETKPLWCAHVERQLYELGALVRGQVPTVSARLADVVEQLEELRKELEAVRTKQEKMADCLRPLVKEHAKPNGKAV